MFSVFFEVDVNLRDEYDLILPCESDHIIGEGKNIEEAFASVRAQIELSNSELPWKMTSVTYKIV